MQIRVIVLNLRMGGQVSSMRAMIRALQERGVDAALMLPVEAGLGDKASLAHYGRLGLPQRMAHALALMRGFARKPDLNDAILHLLLPSPAFVGLLALLGPAAKRTVVQYEAACTRLDASHLAALSKDPLFVAPRLLLNNHLWSLVGAALPSFHLATYPQLAAQLQSAGMRRVVLIPNFADPQRDELPVDFDRSLDPKTRAALETLADLERDQTWCAYVGHAHEVKGLGDLIEAFGRASRQRDDLRLLLALSGDRHEAPWRRRVSEAGISERTVFAGLLPISRVLSTSDALLLPYRMGLSTTIYPSLLLEADAARCPMVVAAIPELSGILKLNHPRLDVVPPGDVAALTGALVALPRREERAAAGSALYLSPAHGRAEDLLEVYAEVMDRW